MSDSKLPIKSERECHIIQEIPSLQQVDASTDSGSCLMSAPNSFPAPPTLQRVALGEVPLDSSDECWRDERLRDAVCEVHFRVRLLGVFSWTVDKFYNTKARRKLNGKSKSKRPKWRPQLSPPRLVVWTDQGPIARTCQGQELTSLEPPGEALFRAFRTILELSPHIDASQAPSFCCTPQRWFCQLLGDSWAELASLAIIPKAI